MAFPYPAKPWTDGQQHSVAMPDGSFLLGTYDASKNLWTFTRTYEDQDGRLDIFTFDVLTTIAEPAPKEKSPFDTSDITNLQTQQDVNWFLWRYIQQLELEGAQVDFSMEATLLEADPTIDETFERNPDEYDQYGDALIYLNAPDHEDTTRIVIPKVDTEGFNWSTVLRAYGKGDVIMTVQVDDNGTIDDTVDDINYRSEWRILSKPVENGYSFSYEVTHIKDMPDHLPAFGEQCYVRLIASQSSNRPPIISDTEPTEHPDYPGQPLEKGDFWIYENLDPEYTTMYYWTGTEWEEVGKGRYVKKTGDTMTGSLVMDNAGEIEMQNTNLDFMAVGESLKDPDGNPILIDHNDGNGLVEQWDPANERFSNIESVSPRLIRSDGGFGADAKTPFGIRVELDDGNTYKNQFRIGNRHGDSVTVYGGGGPQVVFGDFTRTDTAQHGINNGVLIKGIPQPDYPVTPPDFAVNKGYVDLRDEILHNEIIDLQEEIEAIAPSIEQGTWEFDNNHHLSPNDLALPINTGHFAMLTIDPDDGSMTWTDEYSLTDGVVFHIEDHNNVLHDDWDKIEPGELIQLFDRPDPDFVYGEIEEVLYGAASPFGADTAFVKFDRFKGRGKPNNKTDLVEVGKYLAYVNIFKAPSGSQDVSAFVLKAGDDVTCETGPIVFPNENGSSTLVTDSSAVQSKIRFETTNPNNSSDKETVNVWQPGKKNALMTNGHFYTKNNVYTQYIKGWDGSSETSPSIQLNVGAGYMKHSGNDRIQWGSDGGQIKVGSNVFLKWTNTDSYLQYRGANRLYWGSGGVSILKPVNNNTTAIGFKLKGATVYGGGYSSSSIGSNDGDLFYVRHVNGQSDSVRYYGRISDDHDIVTKKYVDDKAGGSSPTYTISKDSNGNFYIS